MYMITHESLRSSRRIPSLAAIPQLIIVLITTTIISSSVKTMAGLDGNGLYCKPRGTIEPRCELSGPLLIGPVSLGVCRCCAAGWLRFAGSSAFDCYDYVAE